MRTDALDDVYRLYSRQVYLYAYSLCGNHHMAEDLTGDTFYKAMLAMDRDIPSIKYWLLRVCRNQFFDQCRKNQGETLPFEEEFLSNGEDPLEQLVLNEKKRNLYTAMRELSQWDRELITMFYFLDCSIQQIAVFTERSPGAVKTALSRARSRLKKLLKEY